jgi:hypothetical protein
MNAGRTTLSFLDLALMLLSAFAYAHFVNLADHDPSAKPKETASSLSPVLGSYSYKAGDFFGGSNAMLTDFAREEVTEILQVHQDRQLTIFVPVSPETGGGERLRQWEKVAARSAAIADAFEKAGQDGKQIQLRMPENLVTAVRGQKDITFTFRANEAIVSKD